MLAIIGMIFIFIGINIIYSLTSGNIKALLGILLIGLGSAFLTYKIIMDNYEYKNVQITETDTIKYESKNNKNW